jgi:hypothetical protein
MGTASLSPATATTSAQQEGATVTTAPRVDEIEDLKVLMAQYALWGDTQQWDKFGSLFHDDALDRVRSVPFERVLRVNLVGYALAPSMRSRQWSARAARARR